MRAIRHWRWASLGCVVAVGGAQAAAPTEAARAPLDRAAFASLPSIYRLESTFVVRSAGDANRRVAVNRRVVLRGTAFGVGPGVVATARHLVRPPAGALTNALIDDGMLALRELDTASIRVDSSRAGVRLRTAIPAGLTIDPDDPATNATVAATSQGVSDLALLTIADRQAPALGIDESTTAGTPIAVVGFGERGGRVPAVRTGEINLVGVSENSSDESRVVLTTPVIPGDSGAPVIDAAGRVHGVAIQLSNDPRQGVMARASAVVQLAAQAKLRLRPTDSQIRFSAGMISFWDRDFRSAANTLRTASDAVPQSGWMQSQARRADQLATATYRVQRTDPWRLPLIAAAVAALTLALLLAARLRHTPHPPRQT